MSERPLFSLLSKTLVAFTIEFDNQAEQEIQHRTALKKQEGIEGRGPWLASLAMWSNFMKYVPEDGIAFSELERLARVPGLATTGMERWRYVDVAPSPADPRPKPPQKDWIIRATGHGRRAQAVWGPLLGTIEGRWRERLGSAEIALLRESLGEIVGQADLELPDYLPTLGFGLWAWMPGDKWPYGPSSPCDLSLLDLPALLSKVLLAFTAEFEREFPYSLAMSANALRVLNDDGVQVRLLPTLTGVSKEAIAISLGFLKSQGCITLGPDPASPKIKLVRLTQKGKVLQDRYVKVVRVLEERWEGRYGAFLMGERRAGLERLFEGAGMALALTPQPGGWRAHKKYWAQTESVIRDPLGALPEYPMVSHRGGYPDGS